MNQKMLESHNPMPLEKKESAAAPAATWLGLRRSALLEIGLFLALALAVDFLFFDGTRFRHIAPHPFWILILLIAVQYGVNEGLVAAVAATAALLIHNLPEQTFSQDMYDYLFSVTFTPLMWLVVALLFGELRQRQIRERDRLRTGLAAAEEREATIAAAYQRLGHAKNWLETRIAGQVRTIIALSQAAKAIEKLEPSEVLFGVVDVVRAVLMPEKFSIYLLGKESLEVTVEEGWSADDKFSKIFAPDALIFQELIGRQRILCSANPDDERILGGEGVLAGPLVSPETGGMVGMLKIERLGFLDLNFTNVQTFKLICEWIATSYANALRFQAARSESVFSYQTPLLSYGFFARQTAFLSELAKRLKFNLSMIILKLENPGELTEEELALIPAAVGQTAKNALRRSDLAFDYERTGWEFAIVLPGTPTENVPIITNKLLAGLRANLQEKAAHARFSLTVQDLHKEGREAEKAYVFLSQDLFRRQTESLTYLAKRMGFDLSIIVLRAENIDALSEEECHRIPDAVGQAIRNVLLPDVPAFAYQRSYWEFMIALPAMPIETAQNLGAQLVDDLTSHPDIPTGNARFTFAIQAMHSRKKLEIASV